MKVKVPKEKNETAQQLGKLRWVGKSKKEIKKHIKMMNKARLKKLKDKNK